MVMPSALQGSDTYAVQSYVNDVNLSAYAGYREGFTYKISESGGTEPAQAELSFLDKTNTLVIPDEAYVRTQFQGSDAFRGFVKSRRPRITTTGRVISVTCSDVSMLLDTTIVVSNQRPAGESDAARIKYLLAAYASQGLFSGSYGSTDVSKIRTLNSSMPKQNFRYLTLRQAIERVLGRASTSSNYYIDSSGRLHTFDSDHPEADAAPWKIKVTHSLAADEAAPDNLQIDFDTQSLINDYWVRGKTAGGSGRFADSTSISLFGRRSAYIDGPDSTTAADAEALGRAALRDTAYPIARGSFTVHENFAQKAGKQWRAGQIVTVTSAMHNISAQPYRIVKVTTEFVTGDAKRLVSVEFGGLRLRLRGGGTSNVNAAAITGSVGN